MQRRRYSIRADANPFLPIRPFMSGLLVSAVAVTPTPRAAHRQQPARAVRRPAGIYRERRALPIRPPQTSAALTLAMSSSPTSRRSSTLASHRGRIRNPLLASPIPRAPRVSASALTPPCAPACDRATHAVTTRLAERIRGSGCAKSLFARRPSALAFRGRPQAGAAPRVVGCADGYRGAESQAPTRALLEQPSVAQYVMPPQCSPLTSTSRRSAASSPAE